MVTKSIIAFHWIVFDTSAAKSEWMIFSEWKNPAFISHSGLSTVSNTCNFIKNDCLFFEVYVRLHATEKSHLSFSLLPHKEHVLTDSLASSLATKVRVI